MRKRQDTCVSSATLTRTGSLLNVLSHIGSDLTGRNLSGVFEPCLGLSTKLAEAMFALIDEDGEVRDLCTLAVVDGGSALGVIYGSTRFLIPVCEQPEVDDLWKLSKVVEAFRLTCSVTRLCPRLLIRVRGNAMPLWPPRIQITTSGDLYEVDLANSRDAGPSSRESLPPDAVVN